MGDAVFRTPMGARMSLRAAAEDLAALAWLHEAERDVDTLIRLHSAGFPDGLTLAGPEAQPRVAMGDALRVIGRVPEHDRPSLADDLAADYAGIYLTHALRASPCESVWRDEEKLMMQGPAFAVRERYRAHGLMAVDWRRTADDHVSNELAFLSYLLSRGEGLEARHFIEEHLLQWLPDFAERVTARASTRFYAALASLTLHVIENLHRQLRAIH
ncbi:molecular chaperone [Zoogloea sp. 1C4]|uniref:TorD/DmsD family molecular chaperone n=1 Tax=Zoogloea sp. 1C4 TaxID=2570190 RepID=UPI0012914FC5|nr:molecular chaperone TorD family protein [Zoogloea sp. 1C4]